MRTLCDVCEAAPARFFCAADEAALCTECDEKVHSCNKLASRHVRLELTESRVVPRCDICENAPAFFFCGVDGTSLCLQCDMDVHVGGKKAHERYLMLGQRVELPLRKPRFEDTADRDTQQAEPNNPDIDKNGVVHDQHHYHHYHHHHHHHHNDEVRAGLPASKPSCDQDDSNAPAIAIAAGDEESLLLDDCQNKNQSRTIDLNSRPKHLLSQASMPDKVCFGRATNFTPASLPLNLSFPCFVLPYAFSLQCLHTLLLTIVDIGKVDLKSRPEHMLRQSFLLDKASDEPLASSDDEDIGVVPELSFKAYQKVYGIGLPSSMDRLLLMAYDQQ